MNEYYVYCLIDPRTNSIFYIGKGKGKRVFQHLKEKEEIHSNIDKLEIIKEIQQEGKNVGHLIIGENLTEEAALLLERILIYRLGRKIFDEGCLTNIVPGGRWHTEASLFLKNDDIPDIESITIQYPELIPIIDNYPHVAKKFSISGSQNSDGKQTLFVFNDSGEKTQEWDIDYIFQIFGLGRTLDLINSIKNESMPVYAYSRVWSNVNYEKLEDITLIPFQDFDLIDFEFVRQINKAIEKGDETFIECLFPDGRLHGKIDLIPSSEKITLTYYYPNGNKKYLITTVERQIDGKFLVWHPNGQIKEETDYVRNKHLNKKGYFPSGNIEMDEHFIGDEFGYNIVKTWYDNGQIRFETNELGESFTYSVTGGLESKGIRTGRLDQGGNLILWDFSEDGKIKKEKKMYYIDGLLRGYEKSYYDTGELKREVDYTNGHNNKIIRSYKKNGELTTK
jgi:antitoxin component YwqK of YwqJK toxin-antitoxin module